MPLRELLVEELQDLYHAETQLTKALPQMAQAAHNPRLKEILEKHLVQTEQHAERLRQAFELLGEKAMATPCKAMVGLIEEGQEKISAGKSKDDLSSDLALITAAQKVEHYEISGYGTAKALARQIGEIEVSKLLMRTLGEEESADYLLTEAAKPLVQTATYNENSKLKIHHHEPVGSASSAKAATR
ncbi:MAG TPA: ferritin-like domain-containing protein [Bryobacteraceae bacterium]|jgi:Mn-containing catalase|nr:ferritin-like domain-containing protein [Bryobacteraceae bacterium]